MMLKLENCAKKWLATWHMGTKLTADREQNSIRRPSTDAKSFARYTYRQGASQKENRIKRQQHQTIDFVEYVLFFTYNVVLQFFLCAKCVAQFFVNLT